MDKGLEKLVEKMIKGGALKTEPVIAAFKKIDRKNFVAPAYQNLAYNNAPLPIGPGQQTISQPSTVATMLELLEIKPGNKILDVGSGSGWTTALLTYLTGPRGEVHGIEIIPELVKFGNANLRKYYTSGADICQADCIGLPDKAPFDKILVSASCSKIPIELFDQLANCGTMVIPVKNSLIKLNKNEYGEISSREYHGFEFVPFVQP